MKNDGKKYEEFVKKIQKSLIEAEKISHLININIETNKKIKDRSGIDREFDIYWEFELGGQKYKTIIECKDYSSPISIDKIDALIGKTNDIPGLKLIYATKTGYQNGAKIKAKQYNIDLLIVRDIADTDWFGDDGTPFLKEVHLKIVAITPPTITGFNPTVDIEWFKNQNTYTKKNLENIFGHRLTNEVFINEVSAGKKYSIHELEKILIKKIPNIEYGSGEYSEKLDNAFIESSDGQIIVKITGYSLTYIHRKPIESVAIIDYSKQIMGIVENYLTKEKKWILQDGSIK
ncbi:MULTISPECIES: restriction endonuclease [unclassified Brenneria]|uniref:restriction endonuclease n=1 Tax=unclassified Brenneria TaxID=2634434 RepID=UPI0015536485|nr:restriction endonuclease [Brenneria sp. hezel4-2-4]MEE3650216.1 restriction endonuclease [Brenneria sp. HEZEL_4_2_4]NPD00173.1 hypothetical protein [Brenneria sp. hezel4-2-4]